MNHGIMENLSPLPRYYRPQFPHAHGITACELPITVLIPRFVQFVPRYRGNYRGIRYHFQMTEHVTVKQLEYCLN